jgi:hypothetical protein
LKKVVATVAFALLGSGCYHATVDTGRAPSNVTIEKAWASGWIYGLVPPSTLETAQKAPSGVAKLETQLSFANQLVNFLTLGIYTPMSIKVTCASGGRADAPTVKAGEDKVASFEEAAELSRKTGTPVLVTY